MITRRALRLGKVACASVLALTLATGTLPAFADAPSENLRGGGHSEPLAPETSNATGAEDATESSSVSSDAAQFSQQVPLDQPSTNEKQTTNVSGSTDATGASDQVAGTVPLPAGSSDSLTSIVADGLVFEVDASSKTAALVGCVANSAHLSVPAQVASGSETYTVTALKNLGGGGHSLTLL